MAPTDEDRQNLPAVKEAQKYTGRWLRIAAWGFVLMGIAAIMQAVDDWVDSREMNERISVLNDQFTCRYIIAQEAQELSGKMTFDVALGLAAYAEGDEAELYQRTQHIRELAPQLEIALQERDRADEICDQPRE